MDNSEDRVTVEVTPKGLEALLRSTPLFTLVGCPDWCSWAVSTPGHEHVTDGVAELVLLEDQGDGFPAVLEVRHASAPVPPTPAQRRVGARSSGGSVTPCIDSWQEQRRRGGYA